MYNLVSIISQNIYVQFDYSGDFSSFYHFSMYISWYEVSLVYSVIVNRIIVCSKWLSISSWIPSFPDTRKQFLGMVGVQKSTLLLILGILCKRLKRRKSPRVDSDGG